MWWVCGYAGMLVCWYVGYVGNAGMLVCWYVGMCISFSNLFCMNLST